MNQQPRRSRRLAGLPPWSREDEEESSAPPHSPQAKQTSSVCTYISNLCVVAFSLYFLLGK